MKRWMNLIRAAALVAIAFGSQMPVHAGEDGEWWCGECHVWGWDCTFQGDGCQTMAFGCARVCWWCDGQYPGGGCNPA